MLPHSPFSLRPKKLFNIFSLLFDVLISLFPSCPRFYVLDVWISVEIIVSIRKWKTAVWISVLVYFFKFICEQNFYRTLCSIYQMNLKVFSVFFETHVPAKKLKNHVTQFLSMHRVPSLTFRFRIQSVERIVLSNRI